MWKVLEILVKFKSFQSIFICGDFVDFLKILRKMLKLYSYF